MIGDSQQERAHTTPFVVFLIMLLVAQVVASLGNGLAAWWWGAPQYWVYPLQTVICSVLLLRNWRFFEFAPKGLWTWGAGLGAVAIAIWISPTAVFGMNRADGFLPHFFAESGAAYWLNLIPRLFRLIVVVPLVEEIFWRGWLARYLVNRDFTKTQVGTFTPLAFWGTSIGFMLEHSPADWPAAFVTGILFNVVAIKTGSLAACVVAHAVANLLLAAYVLQSHQWGYW